jgi:hypothetical protein
VSRDGGDDFENVNGEEEDGNCHFITILRHKLQITEHRALLCESGRYLH